MKILSLNGQWQFKEKNSSEWLPAKVPGSNFSDLLANGVILDPFVGVNEKDKTVQEVALRDWEYRREFFVDDDFLRAENIELVCNSLDTLADVFVNGERALSAKNMFKRYTVDVKPLLVKGKNDICAVFYSPVEYARGCKEKYKLASSFDAVAPAQYIRKAQYHFGWDWGPWLPPSGISGDIYLRAFGSAILGGVLFKQNHREDGVELRVRADFDTRGEQNGRLSVKLEIISPSGETRIENAETFDGFAETAVLIKNPAIWQSNGIEKRETQPLYRVNVYLSSSGAVVDSKCYDIGLRTIELDLSQSKWGENFAFKVNGRRIFAKGANWIPADSFVERVSYDKLDRLIRDMRDANMNMVRVWGGGFYESDDFYSLCDKYGILVWQDCCFACQPYPLTQDEFVDDIEDEIYYNIERIRHRASLAVYCGNNEIEQMSVAWRFNKPLKEATRKFFYETLPGWIRKKDAVTPYRPSSPSGAGFLDGVNSETAGDTHLWRVWHGLSPYSYYRKVYTNFCSEFGMQSLPTMNTIKKFSTPDDYDLASPVMKNHQKNMAGNSIMKYYLVSDFRFPKSFDDLVYLTQIVQAECMREPVEHWRRNAGRCNGALYWQFNDCWPVSSWASVDYYGNYKALQYAAKRFNAPVDVSIENNSPEMVVHAVNESAEYVFAVFKWRVEGFDGEALAEGALGGVELRSGEAKKIAGLDFKDLLKTRGYNCVFVVVMESAGVVISRKTALFKKERKLELPKSGINTAVKISDGGAELTLTSKYYARYVRLEIDGVTAPFSDNFFDMLAGESRTVTIKIPPSWDESALYKALNIKTVADVEPAGEPYRDFLYRLKMNLKPINLIKKIIFAIGL